jgi:O-antigen/teichoic acid export membrane protein
MGTLADQAIVSAVSFLTGVIIARNCSREELGLYTLGFSIMLFVVNLQGSLIASPYMVYSPRLFGRELAVYTTNTLLHQLCLSALAAAFLVIGGKLLAAGYGPPGLAPVVLALAVVIAAVTSREYARQISFTWLNIRDAFLLDCCVAIIQLGGLLFLVSQGELSARQAYFVAGTACGLAAIVWLFLQRSHFTMPAGGAVADFRRNWQLGKWNLAGGLANLAGIQAYPWILAFFHGNAATGSLAACLGIVFIANPVILGLGNFLGPKMTHAFAQGEAARVHRVMIKATLVFFAIMSSFSVVMLFFGGAILQMIYGVKYAGLDMVVGVLALSQFADIVTLPRSGSLFVMGRPDAGFKSYLLALLITLILGLWLVRSYGIYGVAFSLLSASTAAAVYRWVVYRKFIRTLNVRAAG